jgi:hypothetical protein
MNARFIGGPLDGHIQTIPFDNVFKHRTIRGVYSYRRRLGSSDYVLERFLRMVAESDLANLVADGSVKLD